MDPIRNNRGVMINLNKFIVIVKEEISNGVEMERFELSSKSLIKMDLQV